MGLMPVATDATDIMEICAPKTVHSAIAVPHSTRDDRNRFTAKSICQHGNGTGHGGSGMGQGGRNIERGSAAHGFGMSAGNI